MNSESSPSMTPEEQIKLAKARDFIDSYLKAYVQYQNLWTEAHEQWQFLVTMPIHTRPQDYQLQLTKAKKSMERAKQAWEIKGHKSEYETQLAILKDLDHLSSGEL